MTVNKLTKTLLKHSTVYSRHETVHVLELQIGDKVKQSFWSNYFTVKQITPFEVILSNKHKYQYTYWERKLW